MGRLLKKKTLKLWIWNFLEITMAVVAGKKKKKFSESQLWQSKKLSQFLEISWIHILINIISKSLTSSTQCQRYSPFTIIMRKVRFGIKQTEFFYSCIIPGIFDLQYNIVSDIGIGFFASNPIRIKFTFFTYFVVFHLSLPWKYRFP